MEVRLSSGPTLLLATHMYSPRSDRDTLPILREIYSDYLLTFEVVAEEKYILSLTKLMKRKMSLPLLYRIVRANLIYKFGTGNVCWMVTVM